jgi:hypothetical protein
MTAAKVEVRDEFVGRLMDFLAVPSPSIRIRGRLAKARAAAQRELSQAEYEAAMLRAHKLSPAGLPWQKGC